MVGHTLPVGVGDRIAGRYRVERLLGASGTGSVFAAFHEELDELVAIKILSPRLSAIAEARERFSGGARAAVKIENEHVVRVTGVAALDDGTPYVVMEHLEGEDLASLLARRGKIPAREAALFALQICRALKAAHSLGIVHDNLKPTNVFLARQRGGPPSLKVLDFGMSTADRHDRRSAAPYEVLASPWYMAPEQLERATSGEARSDIWSVGILLHELVTGEVPFDGATITETIAKVLTAAPSLRLVEAEYPAMSLEPIIECCLAKDPDERYQSCDELAAALSLLDAQGREEEEPTLASRPRMIPSAPPERVGLEDVELIDPESPTTDSDEALAAEVELLPTVPPPPAAASAPEATPPTRAAPVGERGATPKKRSSRWALLLAAVTLVPAALFASRSMWRPAPPAAPAGEPSPSTPPPEQPPSRPTLEPDERPTIVPAAGASSSPKQPAVVRAATTAARSAGSTAAVPRAEPKPNENAPSVAAPTAASASTEDDAAVGFRVARLNHETLRKTCWDTSEKTTAVVTVTATVEPGGSVRTVSAATSDSKLAQCVESQVRTWAFPASDSMRAFRIPIRFRP